MNLTFHSLNEADQSEVIRFVAEIQRNQNPGFNWSASQLDSEFKMARCFVLKKDEIPVAFASVRELIGAFELSCLAVAPTARGQGIGKILLGHLIGFMRNNADGHRREFWLEVHDKNEVAYKLYSQCGFQTVGRRSNYYGSGEDALLMSLPLDR